MRARILCLVAVWLGSSLSFCEPQKIVSPLSNGGFERGASGWTLTGEAQIDKGAAHGGKASLRIGVGSAQQDVFDLPVGGTFTCTAYMKVQDVRKTADAGYAYMAVYQLDEFGEIVAFHDFAQKTGTSDWQRHSYTFKVEEGCKVVSVRCGLFQATGAAWFDDFTLVAGGQPAEFEMVMEEEMVVAKIAGFEPQAAGNVAVFKDDIPPSGAASSPDYLASVLQRAGFGVAFLNSEQLADRKFLNRATFDVLVLPYGARFPVKAADNFRKFLREGGKFFSTGGYAFDNLLERTPQGWRPPAPPPQPDITEARWRYQIPADELRGKGKLTFSGFLKATGVAGSGMAFFAVYQPAADGSLPAWKDVCQVRGSQDWKEFRYTFTVHPRAARVDLHAGLYRCRGMAWFDDIKLTDETGNVLAQFDFEEEFNPDDKSPHHWWRTDKQLCEVDTKTVHSGKRSLKVRLRYEVPAEERLNTRHGIPGDGLDVAPTQLGVFDADYRLERVRFAHPAPGQSIVDPSLRIDGALEGYAASGVVGFDTGRWIPLINAYDKYGRLRGAVGALLHHYAGTYAGSSWAFFGVSNRDLFAASEKKMSEAFVSIMRSLARDTYFTSLVSDRACYRQGEAVQLTAPVFNGGRAERQLRVDFEIYEGEPSDLIVGAGVPTSPRPARKPLVFLTTTITAPPAVATAATVAWKPQQFKRDFYHVIAHLREGGADVSARPIDVIESGFMVWNEKTIAAGPPLKYQNNYLHLGNRPMFLFGTDDWSYVFTTTRETPLQWLKDMAMRRDFGVQIYENLQFGLPASPQQQEQLLRKVDAIMQLSQKYQQVYFPGLLVGYNVAVSDAELARQKEFCREFAKRYAHVPGLIYYLNGDLRCQLSDAVTPQWNEFLRQRYGTTEKLRQAWGDKAPTQEIGQIPAEDFNDWEHAWDDVKVYDLNCFRAWLVRRWLNALREGIREFDQTHPITAEFYQLPHQGVDLLAAIDGLDLGNFGYFEKLNADIPRFPLLCKYNDQRARGKSNGPGEYGVKTHPAWGDGKDYGYHTARTREQAIEHFLAIPHYALALGASRVHNWCWKDDAHRIFPWGLTYPCDNVEKDILYVHRNQSLLFRHFAPVDEEPTVYLLTADSHRLGGGKWRVIEGILKGIDLALATHVDNLGTLNEQDLVIPKSAKVIFYPLPFCPSDETYAKVLNWVKQGGVLYLSGDISYDEFRQRTRTKRLEKLCGVRFVGENYPNIAVKANSVDDQPCIKVEPIGARVWKQAKDGSPLVVEHAIGKGRVIFTTDPIELHSTTERRASDIALYRRVLQAANVEPIGLTPNDPLIHAFRVPLQDGGRVYVLFNTDQNHPTRQVTLTDGKPSITLTIARNHPALLWFDGRGALRAIEAQGEVISEVGFRMSDFTNGILLTLDGEEVRRSRAMVLMPLKPGKVNLTSEAAWRQAVVEVGEVRGGVWRTFETVSVTKQGKEIQVNVMEDQVYSLLLLCEANDAPRWRQAMERAMNEPTSLP